MYKVKTHSAFTPSFCGKNVSFFKRRYKHGNRNGYWSFINVRLFIIFMLHGL